MLAVHLFRLEHDLFAQTSRDWMPWRYDPQAFAVVGFAPFEIARCSHKGFENLREMPRVQNHQTHSCMNSSLDALDNFVADFIVRHVTPPEEHIGFLEHRCG